MSHGGYTMKKLFSIWKVCRYQENKGRVKVMRLKQKFYNGEHQKIGL